ncbi:hypothetical protein M407DRAFT_26335 [Tulasnella calospora MUT 4182]|uniref:Uncharacterized protein n=1 Tax=Tulasnella calospora MUT 4182 TaxID=1051891 RepID=A0A0C3LS34_9AGAM|nr:hypothetical protein M407DRAFT_26335 [Tulasnella calospora MUT 4182]
MSSIQLAQSSLVHPSYELAPLDLDTRGIPSSTPRRLPPPPSQIARITPTHQNLPSTPCGKTYSIIVAVASGDLDPEQYLHGVEGDLPFVFDELNARTTDTPRVITDVNCESWESRAQVVPANLQHIKLSFIQKASIEEMGQALKQGDLCYIYIGGHTEMDPDGTSCVMPISKDERLHGNVFASWLKDAAGGGGTIIVFADVIRDPFHH